MSIVEAIQKTGESLPTCKLICATAIDKRPYRKVPEWIRDIPALNQGDDISGVVYEVGEGVTEFRKGDRIAAFHEMLKPGGSYAEYGLSWDHTTFFLPKHTSFEGMPIATIGQSLLTNVLQPVLPSLLPH